MAKSRELVTGCAEAHDGLAFEGDIQEENRQRVSCFSLEGVE
jgi:hypothetical protein